MFTIKVVTDMDLFPERVETPEDDFRESVIYANKVADEMIKSNQNALIFIYSETKRPFPFVVWEINVQSKEKISELKWFVRCRIPLTDEQINYLSENFYFTHKSLIEGEYIIESYFKTKGEDIATICEKLGAMILIEDGNAIFVKRDF